MAAEESQFDEVLLFMLDRGEKKAFKEKLKQNPDCVQIKSKEGMTLLHHAVQNVDIEAIKILIENKADLSYEENGVNHKKSALRYAAAKSYFFAIYLAVMTKSLAGKDLTLLLIKILPENITQKFKFTLWPILQQMTLQKLEVALLQILDQANPEDFSLEFNKVLTYVQTKKPNINSIYELIMILSHVNDTTDLPLLLGKMRDILYVKSASAPSSPVIHSSSPIYSPDSFLRETGSDEDSFDLDMTGYRHR